MKIEKIKTWNSPLAVVLIMGLLLLAFAVNGCDEGMQMTNGVVTEPTEPTTNGEVKKPEPSEPTEPTTNGEVKQPEEPSEPTEPVEPEPTPEPMDPVEPEPVEPEPEPASTVTLPPGYELPPELIPATLPTLSENEAALIEADKWVQQNYPDFDATAPKLQTQAGHTADIISLLPYKEREEVYDLFVASVDLPSFAEAAEKMKENNIQFGILAGEANRTGSWNAFREYDRKASIELGFLGQGNLTLLADIYFEENPQDAQYRDGTGHSYYWIILEYYRLQLENPDLQNLYEKNNPAELLELFRQSCKKGYVFGLDNPWG